MSFVGPNFVGEDRMFIPGADVGAVGSNVRNRLEVRNVIRYEVREVLGECGFTVSAEQTSDDMITCVCGWVYVCVCVCVCVRVRVRVHVRVRVRVRVRVCVCIQIGCRTRWRRNSDTKIYAINRWIGEIWNIPTDYQRAYWNVQA